MKAFFFSPLQITVITLCHFGNVTNQTVFPFYWIHYADSRSPPSTLPSPRPMAPESERAHTDDNPNGVARTFRNVVLRVFTSARPWPRREVRIFAWAFVKVASPRRDQKAPQPSLPPSPHRPPVTSCGICSQDVLISFGAPHTSYLAGRLTCKGDISPRFRQWMRHAGYHLAHACIGEGEKSHLSFLWLSFSFVLPPIAL